MSAITKRFLASMLLGIALSALVWVDTDSAITAWTVAVIFLGLASLEAALGYIKENLEVLRRVLEDITDSMK